MKTLLMLAAIAALPAIASAQPRAEDLYAEGQAAYDRADYPAAAAKWQAAYDLSKESGLLFNLAQARRLAGDCTRALATYRHFIREDAEPGSEQHKLAEDLTRELEGQCSEEKVAAPQPALDDRLNLDDGLNARESDRGRGGRSWKIAGIATGGVGIATLAIGLGLGHHGASTGEEITAACRESCVWAELKDKDARGRREVAIGRTLSVAGAVAVAGGAVFYYLGVRRDSIAIVPAPRGEGAVVSWSGSW